MERSKLAGCRTFSVAEILLYMFGWALLLSCITSNQVIFRGVNLSLAVNIILPGFLIGGTAGFIGGGRRQFLPAALCGASVWMFVLACAIIVTQYWD